MFQYQFPNTLFPIGYIPIEDLKSSSFVMLGSHKSRNIMISTLKIELYSDGHITGHSGGRQQIKCWGLYVVASQQLPVNNIYFYTQTIEVMLMLYNSFI